MKMADDVVSMVDVTNPPIRLLAKIASVVVHADELTGGDGHEFDAEAIRSLMADGEVRSWLRGLDVQYPGVLPERRKRCSEKRSASAGSSTRSRAGSARSPAGRRPSAKRARKKS